MLVTLTNCMQVTYGLRSLLCVTGSSRPSRKISLSKMAGSASPGKASVNNLNSGMYHPDRDVFSPNSLFENELLINSKIGYYDYSESNKYLNSISKNTVVSIFHINIRSLNANYKKLEEMLSTYNNKFNVIVLSEIWATNINYFSSVFSDYTFIYSAPKNQKAGGVGFLIKKNISYNILQSSNESDFFGPLAEYMVVNISINSRIFRIYLIYRHPSTSISEFNDLFARFMKLIKPHKRSFIFGDLNIDLNKFDTNVHVNNYVQVLDSLKFYCYSILPTHCDKNYATVLDHAFANFGPNNDGQSLIKSLTIICDITDHYANLIIVTSKEKQLNYNERPYKRIYNSNNIESFQNVLAKTDWSEIYSINNIDEMVNLLTSSTESLSNSAFPLVRCSRRNHRDKCWINENLKQKIRIKNTLYFIAKHSHRAEDKDSYKNYKKELDKQIDIRRIDYFKNLLDSRNNSIKNVWKTLNNMCSFKKNKKDLANRKPSNYQRCHLQSIRNRRTL